MSIIYKNKTKNDLINEIKKLRKQVEKFQERNSEQEKTSELLLRLNRAQKTLGECNEALVRATDPTKFLNEICHTIVSAAGYRLAWVGFAENDKGKTVRPVAQAGFEEGYINTLNLTWADAERGRGPVGTAIRTGKPSVCQSILIDQAFAPWRTEAKKRGYASCISLPLLRNNQAFGALNIYAVESEAFDNQEVELLVNLANDMAYGIISLQEHHERKKMEEILVKARKLESVGILAGGIAHDFNNLLTAILGNISLALLSVDPKDPAYERLSAAEKASLRAKELTRQLLTFSKGGGPVKKLASIGDIIREAASFAVRGTHVLCEYTFPPDLWTVEVDAGQISQVINNLIINATQASAEGGKIKITAENISSISGENIALKPGKYVKVSVSDNGAGISEELLPRIFDPYFTTKPNGNGLGLATSYSIIKKHGGEITVYSRLGSGTTFFIFLPALEKSLPSKKGRELSPQKGKGRVLVMDDEEIIREVTNQMLNELGYEACLACSGTETISLYQNAMELDHPFDAVILDLTVPGGVGGKETMQKLIELDPLVKAVASTGYSNDPVMANCKKYRFQAIITKPYRIQDLGKVLHSILG
ncbi:MAG: hybrid sensor histidine kinase/response regulator [Nitrospiria bacterium]